MPTIKISFVCVVQCTSAETANGSNVSIIPPPPPKSNLSLMRSFGTMLTILYPTSPKPYTITGQAEKPKPKPPYSDMPFGFIIVPNVIGRQKLSDNTLLLIDRPHVSNSFFFISETIFLSNKKLTLSVNLPSVIR